MKIFNLENRYRFKINVLSKFIKAVNDLILFPITYMPGSLGRKLRHIYWSKRFKRCGKNVIIDEVVIIQNIEWISIGDNVWIDKYSVLIAGSVNLEGKIVKKRE